MRPYRELLEASLSAWPTGCSERLDGWLLRLDSGYTRRANAIYPLDAGTQPIADRVDLCVRRFRAAGMRPVFSFTRWSQPPELDDYLAAQGWSREAPTLVMTQPLVGLVGRALPPRRHCLSDWLSAYDTITGDDSHHTQHGAILARIPGERRFLALVEDEGPAACAMGVITKGYLGLFDVQTHAACRRRGHSRQLLAGLLAWGEAQGAHTAYVQVMVANQPAQTLYASLGYREAYTYWYRAQPTDRLLQDEDSAPV